MSNTRDQQQAVGNDLVHQMQKRHSIGEHVNRQIKLQAPEELKIRRQSSPVLHSQHISLHHGTKGTASKPTPPPHPSMSSELAKLLHTHKPQTSKDIHVIDSRSKNAPGPQVCTSTVPHKSTKCPPKRPEPPKQPHYTHVHAPTDPPKNLSTVMPNPLTPHPPSSQSTPPTPTPSPPPPNTSPVKSKRVPVRRAPPPPSEKASLKTKSTHKSYEKVPLNDKQTPPPSEKASSKAGKAASGHKIYDRISKNDKKTKPASDHKTDEKVHTSDSSHDKATPSKGMSSSDKSTPVYKKISMDNKIGPLLEQFERACSSSKAGPIQMPGALYSAADAKPQTSAIPKSQSTDNILSDSPEKNSFPKSQSTDLLSPTSSSQSTDLLKPAGQLPKSQSSTSLKIQKSIIPKSRSSAVLKSQKSSHPKQSSPTPKKDSSSLKQDSPPTSKPPSKNWKPKNSKLQALFHKAERRKRKKNKEEKVREAHHDQEAKHTEEDSHPTKAKHAKKEVHPTKAKHAEKEVPTKAKHAEKEVHPTKAKHAEKEIHPTKAKHAEKEVPTKAKHAEKEVRPTKAKQTEGVGPMKAEEEVLPTKATHAEKDSCPLEAIYAVVQKINMDDSLTPQIATAKLLEHTQKSEQGSQTPGCWIPPEDVPPTSKDPNCEDEHADSRSRKISLDGTKFTMGSQYSRDEVYASLKKIGFRSKKEEETFPPLPPKLYENVFDDPSIIAEHNSQVRDMERGANHSSKGQLQESIDDTYTVMHNPWSKGYGDMATMSSPEQEELPPLPPRLYENIFDDPIIAAHAKQHLQSKDTKNHDLQESMDNTYAVMHNPRNQGNGDSRWSGEQEELPSLPPKLYINIFDDPTAAAEYKHDTTKGGGHNQEELPPPLPPKLYENIFDDPSIVAEHTARSDTANTGSEQVEELPPPLPPKLYENIFDDTASSTKHASGGAGGSHNVERGAAALTNGATCQQLDSKAQLQESADNTYAVMHNPHSKDKGESTKGSEQEDIYIVMHPHPAFVPLIKKYFKKSK